MKTENAVNISYINDTLIDCYIMPHERWDLLIANFDRSRLNFTWNTTSYQNDTLTLKLIFNDPVSISPEFIFDYFVFHIKKKRDLFISREYVKDLHDNYTTLYFPI